MTKLERLKELRHNLDNHILEPDDVDRTEILATMAWAIHHLEGQANRKAKCRAKKKEQKEEDDNV